MADPGFDARLNVVGTLNALEAATRSGAGRFLFTSTGGAIYGEGEGREDDLPFAETAACEPFSVYGQSKLAAEGYLGLYRRVRDLSTVTLRLGNVYGPRQDPALEAGVVAIFCELARDGGKPTVFGDGEQTRDYVHVADVVAALLAARESDAPGPFNVGTGVETTVLQLAERKSGRWPAATTSSRSLRPPATARSSARRSTPPSRRRSWASGPSATSRPAWSRRFRTRDDRPRGPAAARGQGSRGLLPRSARRRAHALVGRRAVGEPRRCRDARGGGENGGKDSEEARPRRAGRGGVQPLQALPAPVLRPGGRGDRPVRPDRPRHHGRGARHVRAGQRGRTGHRRGTRMDPHRPAHLRPARPRRRRRAPRGRSPGSAPSREGA